ncbi:MAG: DUF4932 domain-containing protein, partial [Bacteroidota bacterium]
MRTTLFTLLLCVLACTCGRAQSYEVNVHPGQELLTVIQILADRYPTPNKSAYAKDMEAHFRQHENHPAVKAMAEMSEKIYTDFPELGWCFYDFPTFKLSIPETNLWYDLYGKDTVQQVVRLAKDFADTSDFWSFYEAHKADYQAWGSDVRHALDSLGYVEKLDAFFSRQVTGERPTFYIAMDPLNSWGAHAIPHLEEINPYYNGTKAYSLGYWNRESTEKDSPSFKGGNFLPNLVWHEGSHIYLKSVLDGQDELIESIAHLYNGDERSMQRQNISTWHYCFEENLVRGIVIALNGQHRTHRQRRVQAAKELINGFLYAEDIAAWLE